MNKLIESILSADIVNINGIPTTGFEVKEDYIIILFSVMEEIDNVETDSQMEELEYCYIINVEEFNDVVPVGNSIKLKEGIVRDSDGNTDIVNDIEIELFDVVERNF